MKYRKKPVVIDAHQFIGNEPAESVPDWFALAVLNRQLMLRRDGRLTVCTLEDGSNGEAVHFADVGDWIIKGVQGELYPCKPDIFAAAYDLASPSAVSSRSAEPAPILSHLDEARLHYESSYRQMLDAKEALEKARGWDSAHPESMSRRSA